MVGGAMISAVICGVEDRELYTRWVQFGVFSPIFRLHSTKNAYHDRRPWGYDAEVLRITRDAMQLRHALIPYLYTLSWLNEMEDLSPVRPMYHDHPDADEAYSCPQQYLFGRDLIVAPFTEPADPDTRLTRQVVWLPEGDWYDFFSGQYYAGDAWYAIYGRMEDIPVFARAGSVVPSAPRVGWGGVDVPDALDIYCFAGANGQFTLFEDDGETLAYQAGAYSLVMVEQQWQEGKLEIVVHAPEGDQPFAPAQRQIRVYVRGVGQPAAVQATIDGTETAVTTQYDAALETLTIEGITLPREGTLVISVASLAGQPLLSRRSRQQETLLQLLESFRMNSLAKGALAGKLEDRIDDPQAIIPFELQMTPSQTRALLEVMLEAGVHHITNTAQPHLVVLWNNRDNHEVGYQYSRLDETRWHAHERFHGEAGIVPHYQALAPRTAAWQVSVTHGTQSLGQVAVGEQGC
ncbi:MAG: glycoside hydrolase family 31 protein [Chloroflexota bacterium]